MRVWLGRLLLLLAGTAAGLALAEGMLRLLAPAGGAWMVANSPALYDTRIFYVDAERRLGLQPNTEGTFQTPEFRTTVRINASGLRGGPVSTGSEVKRVLAVGDSFTLGVQVSEEDTFQARLSAELSARLGQPVEVLNGGVDSHGTFDALRQVERVSAEIPLDAVVLTFFTGNDLWDDCNHHRRRLQPGPLRPPRPAPLLRRVSHLYTWVSVWQASREMAADPRYAHRFREELILFTEDANLPLASRCSAEALQELSAALSDRGLPGIVGLAPPAFAVHTERLAATFALVDLDPARAAVDGPAEAVRAVMPAELAAVDLTGPLRAAGESSAMYFTFDGHWTAAGHAVVAETYAAPLAEVLR